MGTGLCATRLAFIFLAAWIVRAGRRTAQRLPSSRTGSAVQEPEDLRSRNGVLKVDLTIRNYSEADGSVRYCYRMADGNLSPNLRVNPGDLLILNLKNDLTDPGNGAGAAAHHHNMRADAKENGNPCTSGAMTATSTNLHFHGLTIPPVCHQDDVLKTSVSRAMRHSSIAFAFRPTSRLDCIGTIPTSTDSVRCRFWVERQARSSSKESSVPISEVAGLPERVLIIRDQDLLNPNAPPSKSEPVVPKMLIDRDGDAANNGTGFGKPAKDLSINFVPVPYPDYPPAVIAMKPGGTATVACVECLGHYISQSGGSIQSCASAAWPGRSGWRASEPERKVGRFCQLADPSRSAARGARGIHCEGTTYGR